ncbi:MAG: hypothetical protein QFF03_19625 [Pseudomonadota bacterium]|nr:hypothetical protein [Pseudomonadota bacterium]
MMRHHAAIVSVALFAALGVFQAALAAGMPAGQYAWGGRFSGSLPDSLRWASLAALPVLAAAAWVILARADLARPGSGGRPVRAGAWCITAFLALNVVGNLLSASAAERQVMAPLALLLLTGCGIVAASPAKPRQPG